MLKKFKLKITAVIVFASMFMTLIPTLGVFADVPVSNADDYFANIPAITKDIRFNQTEENIAKLTGCSYGIGIIRNDGQTDSHAYKVKIESEAQKLLRFKTLADPDNAARNYFLQLNFGLYDGENEVTTYYGTKGIYSYAVDLNLNFANKSDGTQPSVDATGADSRAYFALQGYGSAPIYLYPNGYKLNGGKVANFTNLTDGKLENGSYTAVYIISMGSDLASSKGSWKLLKKDINGNVTQIIPLSQNIALAAKGSNAWDIYNTYGLKIGLNCPYANSFIEISGARFYKEGITEDAVSILAQLPTLTKVSSSNANSNVNMTGKLSFEAQSHSTFDTVPGKITVRAPYGASWVSDVHRNHFNGVWFNFDDVAAAPNAGTYISEADITTHNLGSLEIRQSNGKDVAYPCSVDNQSGNRMRWYVVGNSVDINIYKDGLADNSSGSRKVKTGDISNANLKLIGVINVGNDTKNADLAIYYKKDSDPIKFAFSRKVDVSSLTSISGSGLCLNAPIETEDKPVSMDITGVKFYKKDVSNSLSFNSVSYTKGDDGITVNAKYDYTRASDMNYTVIAAVYDTETNELTSVDLQNVSVNASDYIEGTKDVSINLDYTGDMTGKNVKLFTWNSIEGMVPMFVSESVNNA